MPGSDILCQTRNWGRRTSKTHTKKNNNGKEKASDKCFGGDSWNWLAILVSWKLYNLVGINAH